MCDSKILLISYDCTFVPQNTQITWTIFMTYSCPLIGAWQSQSHLVSHGRQSFRVNDRISTWGQSTISCTEMVFFSVMFSCFDRPSGSHHTAPYSGAAGAVVLGESCSTELQRKHVWDAGLSQQRVEERL